MGESATVVITGASSGIGRATARLYADDGARLVLAGRDAGTLEAVAAECRDRGARVVAVPTDVSSEADVDRLAETAVEHFGGIDVWVGNASLYSFGTFEQTPSEVFDRLVEVNLLGQVYGARAALRVFRRQGRGVLVSVASVYSRITSPLVSPYVTSKFGLLGFLEVLRMELRDAPDIHVCAVLPATIDTPIHQHAANYTGRPVRPLPPVADPVRVARAIVRVSRRPRRLTQVGRVQSLFVYARALAPAVYEPVVARVYVALALKGGSMPEASGNVFRADREATGVTGGWRVLPWLRRGPGRRGR
ncbi:SDR family NAD(P)-dependent oxidoreductase [Arthrobacter agilis]|jgi:NAD(P)-dependent dehydrogenase (short-subunit alcohol dehydrogenase family)|uniref:SDR family NAD(P)-dependent oxidoreductase n=1 Tax=Arthrobacter agilis TaxID=37921 RepID=UPI002788F35E|nr:SDR family NAD(P)-dependent oxidoreductase [Arthrobacter agilis]MDQ0733559.1 NAD(P)-dependent dehydrogenase (short-subunit alcohol dehydrogenase family) [Arthrobacter agilis]